MRISDWSSDVCSSDLDEVGSAVLDGHAASRMTPSLNRSIHSRRGGRDSTGTCAATAWNSTRAKGAQLTIEAISRGGKKTSPRNNSDIVTGRVPVDRGQHNEDGRDGNAGGSYCTIRWRPDTTK